MAAQLWRLASLLVAVAAPTTTLATATSPPPDNNNLSTSDAAARLRGPEVFNAVHHAMRQWGSSLHHNGMSFYLATVPEGVLFHHGNRSPDSPAEPDWLAYEIEHAENFARSPPHGPPGGGSGGPPPPPSSSTRSGGNGAVEPEPWWSSGYQAVIGAAKPDEPGRSLGNEETAHGYLHTYKTTRPLQFLYVDGMSGGKTSMGTLDSQDYLLRGLNSSTVARQQQSSDKPPKPKGGPRVKGKGGRKGGGPMGERERATDLCALCKEWGLQGVIRMEAGFEIIKCDFSDGLEAVQVLQRPDKQDRGGGGGGVPGPGGAPGGRRRGGWTLNNVEYARGLSERYQGIGASRTLIDYSSMVSAFFYPVDLANPDPKRPDLPRLSSVNATDLALIKKDLGAVIAERRGGRSPLSGSGSSSVDWQGVSDMIVGRYADRIQFMAEKIDSVEKMAEMVDFLLTLYIDYSEAEPDKPAAVRRCRDFYLSTAHPVTEADRLIKAGFEVVTNQICTSLFEVRDQLTEKSSAALPVWALPAAKVVLHDLMKFLQWTRFKRCPPCAVSEVCLIPMWPMGTVEEYNSPRCTDGSDTEDGVPYWGGGPGQGGPGGKPPHDF